MMTCPYAVYEDLKDKNSYVVHKAIRKLRRSIESEKRKIEKRFLIPDTIIFCPTPETKISCYREYIEQAKRVLREKNINYRYSKKELIEKEFDQNVENICEIRVEDGPAFGLQAIHVIKIQENGLHLSFLNEEGLFVEQDIPSFYDSLRNLHLCEWRRKYLSTDYGVHVLDGSAWSVEIYYKDGKKKKWEGLNAYPYNYNDLLYLLGLYESDDN